MFRKIIYGGMLVIGAIYCAVALIRFYADWGVGF